MTPEAEPRDVLEFRLHGRGGQGGVTCAKILAAVYAGLGKSVQTFGDYSGERSGAPVRAYTRVADRPITNRNKVYRPDHLLVLDPTLLGDEVVAGLAPGGLLLVNTPKSAEDLARRFPRQRIAAVDATEIARRHRIGTRSVVIVNTTIAGACVRALGLPWEALEQAYHHLGLTSNLGAAREAHDALVVREPDEPATNGAAVREDVLPELSAVVPLTDGGGGAPTGLRTGSWRTQMPRYVENLAPCNAWCPAGNDVVGFLQALARGQGEDAAAAILAASSPLPGVCGRVCPAPCMEGCNRTEHDGAVNVRALERWIADRAQAAAPSRVRPDEGARRFAVVGGGPAGLSAAYHLALAGQRVTLFDGEAALGGVLHTGIPRYRLPREVVEREVGRVLALGVETRLGAFLAPHDVERLGAEFDAVVLATGLQRQRAAELPGDDLPGVEQGLHFLRRVNLGGDASLSGHVVVLGGGNTAMDCARSALRSGAERVTVAYRRGRSEMPAIREEIEEAEHEGVALRLLVQPVAFHGSGRVEAVELAEVELGEPDASGRRRPVVTSRTHRLGCDHVLLALGQSADRALLPRGLEVEGGRARRGAEWTNLFVAGDFSTGDGTVTHAIGDGRRAAGRALAAVGGAAQVFERPDRSRAVAVTDLRLEHFPASEPAREPTLAAAERVRGFEEVHRGLGDAAEAARCFSCGHCTSCDTCLVYCPEGIIRRRGPGYEVDYSYCKGCGICVTECPRKGMEMTAS